VSFDGLIEAIIDGVLTGGVYALMAAGLSLIFGVMDIINIAQGAMVVLAAYLSYVLAVHLGIDLFAGLLITIPAMFLLGMVLEWGFMRRLREGDRASMSILVTYAFAIIIEGVLTLIFGTDYVQLSAPYINDTIHLLNFYVPVIYLLGFALAAIVLAGLYLLFFRTRYGRGLRASMQNRTAADLIGVNVTRTRMIAVGIGVAVTACGGMVFGATNAFNPNSGYDLISRLLAIVILAGMGSIGGAMVSAVLLVVLADVVAVWWSPVWSVLVFFGAILLVLSIRPNGLFGTRAVRAQ
jgi:branched-chain amino acid transport system permease protein